MNTTPADTGQVSEQELQAAEAIISVWNDDLYDGWRIDEFSKIIGAIIATHTRHQGRTAKDWADEFDRQTVLLQQARETTILLLRQHVEQAEARVRYICQRHSEWGADSVPQWCPYCELESSEAKVRELEQEVIEWRDDRQAMNAKLVERSTALETELNKLVDAITSVQDWSGCRVGDCLDSIEKLKG